MNTLDVSSLEPGQVFSAPVYIDDVNLLVPAMVPLRNREIDLLVSLDITTVTTEGTIVDIDEFEIPDLIESIEPIESIESLEPIESMEPPKAMEPLEPIEDEPVLETKKEAVKFSIKDVQQNSGPYRIYRGLIEKAAAIFTGLKSGIDIEMRAVNNIGSQLLRDLRENTDSFIDYILGGEVTGHELAKSSVNTAILSALTAQELHLPNHKILTIISGALLHDVGMLRLSRGITEKKGGLSDAELEQIKSHPMHSSKIVTRELFGPHEVNLIALQHHERWDGKGYPDNIIGPAIDIGARIVSVADAFEAMVSKKSYRNSMAGYQAIKNLMADNGRRFDPAVISAFTKVMGIYPIGSIVKLNDNSVARVVKVKPQAPLRPVIQMLLTKNGQVLKEGEGATIDLLAERTLFIKNAINPEESAGTNE